MGDGAVIRPPFFVDFGRHIHFEPGCFLNYNCVFLDVAEIRVGARTQIGPAVQVLTADHPRSFTRADGRPLGSVPQQGADGRSEAFLLPLDVGVPPGSATLTERDLRGFDAALARRGIAHRSDAMRCLMLAAEAEGLRLAAGPRFGVDGAFAQNAVIAIVGIVMVAYVMIGGMKGTTWVQMIKAVLLIAATAIMTVWVLGMFGMNFSSLMQEAVDKNPAAGEKLLEPGLKYGVNLTTKIDFISLSLALVLGTAGLPHVLQRFYTVPTSRQARKSVEWAIWLIGGFYLLTLVIGYGAGALVGPEVINAAPGKANAAAPLLAYELGGSWLLGIVSGIAFATILAVVAGLTITASASFAHDLYNQVFKHGKATPEEEVKVARWAAVGGGVIAILGGMLAKDQNIAFLVALAFAVAASANLPTILYSLFWKRFNTRGAVWSIYGGLLSAVGLIFFSPVVSGKGVDPATGKTLSMLPASIDFHWFPLDNPGLVSIPLGFFLGWLGTVTSKEFNEDKYAEMEVRSLTGHGVAEAIDH